MYADEQDLVDRYGEEEIKELTDRAVDQDNQIDSNLLAAKIFDAENEINQKLTCCYSLKKIKDVYDDSLFVPMLLTWTCKITRKNLYDSIRLGVNANGSDHQAQREYEECVKEIDKVCECGDLWDSELNIIPRKPTMAFMEDEPGCYPTRPCCLNKPCCHE